MKSLSRGPSPVITLKIPRELLAELDRECRKYGLSRSAVVRRIIRASVDYARREDA